MKENFATTSIFKTHSKHFETNYHIGTLNPTLWKLKLNFKNVHVPDVGKVGNAGRGEALNGVVETIKEEEEEAEEVEEVEEQNGHIGNGV